MKQIRNLAMALAVLAVAAAGAPGTTSLAAAPALANGGNECAHCNIYSASDQHSVCGFGSLWTQFPHCNRTSPGNCNGHGHDCHFEDEDAQAKAVIDRITNADEVNIDDVVFAMAISERVVLNHERHAVQVMSCDDLSIVSHLPMDPIMFRVLAQQ